jgi:hypothetical protein
MKDSINTVSLAITLKNAKENRLNTNIRMITDFAKVVLNLKLKNQKEFRKILILIKYLIAKEPVNKKVYRFKRLSTVQLDIVKDAMTI